MKQANLKAVRKKILKTKVGKTGYVFIVGTRGHHKGRYIISKDGKRDGEYLLNIKDAEGTHTVREIIKQALSASDENTPIFRYLWKNKDDRQPRTKTAALQHFKPWGWVIGASIYHDEMTPGVSKASGAIRNLIFWELGVGIAIAVLAGLLASLIGTRFTRPFSSIIRITNTVAAGDLSAASTAADNLITQEAGSDLRTEEPVVRRSLDEALQLLLAVRGMTDQLNSLVGQVQRSGIQVNSSSLEISASAKELDVTISEQATATNQVLATTTQISAVARELENVVGRVADVSAQAAATAGAGQSDLETMGLAMRHLADATGAIVSRLAVINEKTDKVNSVVATIGKVADQTNLLSLNAAIEAEKAGSYGRGFAVVAREIRRLADQTAIATQEIEQIFKEMQSAVGAGVKEMDTFSHEVASIVEEVKRIADQQRQIIEQVQTLKPELTEVNEGMSSQAEGAEQIREAMVRLNEGAQQAAESLSEFQKSADFLNQANKGLQKETSHFKVVGSDDRPTQ
jgi:methyl-accepting chemotaxis protein WspA